MNEIQERMTEILSSAGNLFDREEVCRKTLLALASEESVFLYGPPGTAKSMIAKWAASILDTKKYFSCLLNQYTQPDELFGPVSIQALEKGTREILTEGYMPDSEIAFLDEIWKAGPAILNTLLTLCNEKTFKNGNRTVSVPLKLLMSASNEFPGEDSGLEPLYDRFLIRICISPIGRKDNFVSMITGKTRNAGAQFRAVTAEELESWRKGSAETEVPKEITDFLYSLRLRLNERDIYVSDRRWKKIVNLLRTSAFLNGRKKVAYSDLFVIEDAIWSRPEERDEIRECAAESVTGETVRGSFAFVERISNEISGMRNQETGDGESYQKLVEKINAETSYLNTLKKELEIARSGGENFWKNVFSGLSGEFELEMMNRGIERLREFITEAEGDLENLRFSKKPELATRVQAAQPTVILKENDGGQEEAREEQHEGRFEEERAAETEEAKTQERQVMSIREMQDESFRKIQETLSMNLSERTETEEEAEESEGRMQFHAQNDSENPETDSETGRKPQNEQAGQTEQTVQAENAETEEETVENQQKNPETHEEPTGQNAQTKESEREKIKEQIQQAIRRNQVEEQSRSIIQNGISRIIKAFAPEKVQVAPESEIEHLKENTERMRQELTQMSHAAAEVSDEGADEVERSAYETKLSTTRTFAEFVEMSHYKYLGDSSDRRYKWNENSNNGAKWWNVGSRFYQMLDGDRNTLSAIEAECAKRGAKIGGKYHWVFSVCYIFEKNDGIYDWKTRAELRWLLGNAWRFLEPVFNEALL